MEAKGEERVVEAAGAEPGPDEDVRRLAAFSDGVFAIAMTLLVLDLDKPNPTEITTSAALRDALAQWSAYGAFVLSFAVIALYWRAHFFVFRRMRRVDGVVIWLNLLLLLGITFLPFPTAVLQRFDQREAVMLYAGTLAAIGFVWVGLLRYAVDRQLLAASADDRRVQTLLRQLLETPMVFLASMGVAVWEPLWAIRMWILVLVGHFVERRLRSKKAKLGHGVG